MMILFGILAVVSALGIVLARWLGSIAPPKVCLAVSVPVFFISFSLLLVTMPDGNWSSLGGDVRDFGCNHIDARDDQCAPSCQKVTVFLMRIA